jgi:hypothetical protein
MSSDVVRGDLRPPHTTGILIFKGLTARRLYKSFGDKGLMLCLYVYKYVT